MLPSYLPSMDFAGLLQRPESKTLEFKRDLSSPEKILRAIVSFANTAGGLLVIGVDAATKRVRSVVNPLKEEERLTSLIDDRIAPKLIPTIEIVAWRSAQIIVVEVYPSPNRPHFLKSLGPVEGVYVRIGSTNRKADAALIQEMRRLQANETFDETPRPDLGSEAIDFRAASELFASRANFGRTDLLTLRALTTYERRTVPTVGGLLLFGKEHNRYFPDAWIQCGRFAGVDKTTLSDAIECRDTLPRILEVAYDFIKKHATRGLQIEGLKHRETTSIP